MTQVLAGVDFAPVIPPWLLVALAVLALAVLGVAVLTSAFATRRIRRA